MGGSTQVKNCGHTRLRRFHYQKCASPCEGRCVGWLRLVIALTLATGGGACATGSPFETTHTEVETGLFYVTATGSSSAEEDEVVAAWHQRARGVCPGGYESLVNRSSPRAVHPPEIALPNRPEDKRYVGYARCKQAE